MLERINYSNLVRFSVPSVLAALVEPLASVVDTALVGRFSTDLLASMAICVVIFSSLSWIFNFLIHTSTQKVADYQAQQNVDLKGQRIKISISLALFIGFLTMSVMLLFKDSFYLLAGASPNQYTISDQYYYPRSFGHIFSVLFMTLLALVRGLGKVKAAFSITLVTTILNIILSALLLYHYSMGLTGIALGTILSHFIGVVGCLFIIFYRETDLIKSIFKGGFEKGEWIHFGKNSLDVFGRSFALTGCFFLATRFSAKIGVTELAAHQILLQLWLFCSFFIDGLASSANILMSYYRGKNDGKALQILNSMFIKISAVLGVIFMLTYALGGSYILGLFTKDEMVIALCFSLLPLIAGSQIISCLAFINDGVLFGLEKFSFLRTQMWIGTLFVFLPLALMGHQRQSLIWIWMGLISLNIYRVLTTNYKIKKEVSIPQ